MRVRIRPSRRAARPWDGEKSAVLKQHSLALVNCARPLFSPSYGLAAHIKQKGLDIALGRTGLRHWLGRYCSYLPQRALGCEVRYSQRICVLSICEYIWVVAMLA